ncbi:Uncharacterized protein APZ42_024216 [Daphnia magna]|uniref:Uncharacterized protein n=1 Tax=Daphnia magna TaxID=35525 RepID=A0A164UJY0_9CRUS|nr:Uncharacterized protein APZ42_024216 [Daphnia magna]
MKSTRIVLFAIIHVLAYCHLSLGQSSGNWNFAFNFAGYKRQNGEFLLKECPKKGKDNFEKTVKMIDAALQKDALEMPTTNRNKTHVQCVKDPVMGNVVNFTIYKNGDNDYTGNTDRQRMEMKGKEEGKKGNTFLYAWWFKIDPNMKNTDEFYHIFQIKTGGTKAMTKFPLATLTLTNKDKFHVQPNYLNKYGEKAYKLLGLQQVKGKWIQVFVEAAFKKKSEGGYIRVTMKDEKGKDLIRSKTIEHEMWWDNANFRPKWGLYRKKSPGYQPSDWQLFQNVQIWKKN